jgi:hypothetical protein
MGRTYITGSYNYNALCDVCQFKFKASQLRKRWDGLMVCDKDWELRHPLDFYQTRNDTHKLPFIRSDNMIFLEPTPGVYACNTYRQQGEVGVGTVGCAVIGRTEY